ncbi:MAG: hypothetical protein A2Y60_01500 [Chloroflexi bacterium RBG_13_54_9]|nr:MAG: hypothetical protein A2Y60_01500 [Chloroflexi bacterium RBG_13_54_9]
MASGRTLRTVVVGITVILSLLLVVGSGCTAATKDFTITSSVDVDHSHKVTISGADIESPPAGKTITTTQDGAVPHTHTITFTKQDYETIKKGEVVNVTSSAFPANNHTHKFAIKKP